MDQYVNQLLKDQGVPENLDPEVRQQLIAELNGRISDFINRRLVDSMSDEALPPFEAMLDQQPVDQQQVQQYINEHVPNMNDVVTKALLEFRTIYLGDRA
jgi:hypothetical protein